MTNQNQFFISFFALSQLQYMVISTSVGLFWQVGLHVCTTVVILNTETYLLKVRVRVG